MFFLFYPHTVTRCKGGHSRNVCMFYPHSMHIISTLSEFPWCYFFFFYSAFPFASRRCSNTKICQTLLNQTRASLIASFHWLVWPRSLCDRLGLNNWVCVGPLQLSTPALPPLRFRKQTVSLTSTRAAVEPLLLITLSSCFLWANANALSCSWASFRSNATSSCCWPMVDEQKEEDDAVWPALSFLSSLQGVAPQVTDITVAAGVTLVCIQDTSLSWWHWTEGMMGMEQERNGGGGEWLCRRPGLLRLRVAGLGLLCWDGAYRPECTSMRPLQGEGSVVAMETGVCICRMASCLGSSCWFSPCISQLEKLGNEDRRDRDEENRNRAKVTEL